jgi:two-component system response regulator VanR
MENANAPAKRVLIVDDDPTLRRLLKFGFTHEGYQCFTAGHGQDAIDLLAKESVDLVLVDLMMPVMDGLRFVRWLRQESQSSIPVVIFSSHSAANIMDEAATLGANVFVPKPVKLPELLAKVAELLKS